MVIEVGPEIMVRYIHYIITNNYLDYKYEDKFPNDKICTTVED